MKKIIKVRCKSCGLVDLPEEFSDYDGEQWSFPVAYFPNIRTVGKHYKEMTGSTYMENTGNKIGDSFERVMIEPSHESLDEVGWEKMQDHILEPIECWEEVM